MKCKTCGETIRAGFSYVGNVWQAQCPRYCAFPRFSQWRWLAIYRRALAKKEGKE